MTSHEKHSPQWDNLYAIASAQGGYFTSGQAVEAGYSLPLLNKHIKANRIQHIMRGVYRLVHFPIGEHDDLCIVWLWSKHTGVFSHETALALHQLSDVLPAQIHITLPAAWGNRRIKVPEHVRVYCDDVSTTEQSWRGPVPITTVQRTLEDCARDGLAPDLLRQAAQQAIQRNLVDRIDLCEVARALKPFGGIGT